MEKSNNFPRALIPLVEQWIAQDRSFFISSENFFCDSRNKYFSRSFLESDSPEPWYAKNKETSIRPLTPAERQEIELYFIDSWVPTSWALILDYRCNYSCPMCPFQGDGYKGGDYWGNRANQRRHVPLEVACRWLDDLAANGITDVCLSSPGELFLYPHWEEVLLYSKKLGLKTGTITNGSLVTTELCQKLQKCGLDWIHVSLDAVSQQVYAKVRSNSIKHYQAAMDAPLLLKKHGFAVQVHFVVQDENVAEKKIFFEKWIKQGIKVSCGEKISYTDDGCSFIKSDSKFVKSPSSCSACISFCTMADGTVAGCCHVQTLVTDSDQYGLALPTMDEGVSTVIRKMKTIYHSENNVVKYCTKCGVFADSSLKEEVFGFYKKRTYGRSSEAYERYGPKERIVVLAKKILPAPVKKILKSVIRR